MLKLLRKKGIAKKVLWIVAIVVIISFGFFGKASLINNTSENYAGSIFGKKISLNEFEKIYRQVQLQAVLHYGEDFNTVNSMLNLQAETWNRLILLHDAKRKNIKVTDEEVIQTIEQYPFFQRDGEFDSLLYNNALRYAFRVKPRDFEESIRNTIKIAKLRDIKTNSIQLDAQEVFETYKKENEKAQISYVLINADQFLNDVSVEDEYLKQYYAKHKTEFLRPPSIQVDYIRIPFPQTKAENQVDDQDADISKYETYQKAQSLYQDILDGNSLNQVAQKYAVDVETTDYFSIERPLFIFGSLDALNKIFHLDQGETTEPLETEEAIFIVQMKNKKDAYIPDYKEALDEVKKAVKKKEAKRIAKVKAKEYLKQIQQGLAQNQTFLEAVRSLNLKTHQTPLFHRGQYLPIVGLEKDFQETAFQLTGKNRLSDIVGTSKGYSILYLDTYVSADKEKFQEEKANFQEKLLIEKKMQAFNDYFAKLKAESNLKSNFQEQR